MWDTLMVVSGEETGDVGKLRVESLACIPMNLDFIYGLGIFKVWSSGDAASNSTEGLLAIQIPGPHPQRV